MLQTEQRAAADTALHPAGAPGLGNTPMPVRPPTPASDDMLDRLRRSCLVPPAELDEFLARLPDVDSLLPRLLAEKLLTPFQADRLAAGKYKGFVLGSYVVLDKLGTGGMGQVFLAEHTGMKRLVAIKVLRVPAADDPAAFERFLREARAAAAVNHPNIVQVFDLNRDGKLNYLVMEYVDGVTLTSLVQAGQVSVAAATDYARQVALALQHGYERGLVHRDVKPNNVMVDRCGTARLLDLGLVRFEQEKESTLTSRPGGCILGTADYLAPEQAVDSSTVDIRADIYALGATLYFMLAGHPLFPSGKTAQKLMWQQWREPTPIRELRPDVPPALAAILATALAKKPADRFQTPQELADALVQFAETTAINPALIPAPPMRKWTTLTGDVPTAPVTGRAVRPRPSPASAIVVELADPPVQPAPAAKSSTRPELATAMVATLSAASDVTDASHPVPPLPEPTTAPGFWAGLAVGAGALGLVGLAAVLALALR